MSKRTAEELTERLIWACFTERDEAALAAMMDGAAEYALGSSEPVRGAAACARRLMEDTEFSAGSFLPETPRCAARPKEEGTYSVSVDARFLHRGAFALSVSGNVVWKKRGDGYAAQRVRLHCPENEAERLAAEREALERALAEKSEELEKLREKVLESEERYRVALAETGDVLVEIDLKERTTVVDEAKFRKLFGCAPLDKFHCGMLVDIDTHVHPEDREKLRRAFRLMQDGESWTLADGVHSLDHRIKNDEKGYLWVRATTVPIRDSAGNVVKIIESIKNIDEEKRKELEMLNASQHDPLTGMWNRVRTERLVEKCLRAGVGFSVMMVADIDNFKAINDNLGHLLGDAVLRDISARIKRAFDGRGVVGRIGGDEFLVFLPDAGSRENAQREAAQLVELLRSEQLGKNSAYAVSGSVGAACYPEDGDSYVSLFQKADRALYSVKNRDKNGAAFFQPSMAEEKYISREKTTIAASDVTAEDNIITYIFRVLYETPDIQTAINLILRIVGRTFDVSRVYIFENSPDCAYCCNTYEWCNEGISEQQDALQNIKFAELGYAKNFDANGIFYCEDVRRLPAPLREILLQQDIHSVLQCSIVENGVIRGFVGFDECKSNRFWTKNEIGVLTLISKIISTFLLKKQSQDDLTASQKRLHTIMDTLSIFTYIVEPETYRLMYMNQHTRTSIPGARLGEPCYKAFFGKKKPCRNCPMRELMAGGSAESREIYNRRTGIWISAQVSKFDWEDGKQVCLICCTNITKYKAPAYAAENQTEEKED